MSKTRIGEQRDVRDHINSIQSRIRSKCKQKNYAYDLTRPYLKELIKSQGFVCAITKIPFRSSRRHHNPYSPSLDRIVPHKGYIQGNVRFILMGVNGLKGTGSDEDIFSIAVAVVRAAPEGVGTGALTATAAKLPLMSRKGL